MCTMRLAPELFRMHGGSYPYRGSAPPRAPYNRKVVEVTENVNVAGANGDAGQLFLQ